MQRTFQAGWAWTITGIVALTTDAAVAQVRPDATLGAEGSRVRAIQVTGRDGVMRDSDVIEGGAQRGSNLFHSFEQFDVPEGRGAYFANPVDVRNIFGRVTSADRSEINGTLGVLGNANLFFMNPNGILFGPSSSLDLGGSFVGTTSNAIGFGDLRFFSATNPEVPSQLLTIDPSAFLFNQIPENRSEIINQSEGGLSVLEGQNLSLLGSNVINDGGDLNAFEGRIEIGAVAEFGMVELNGDGSFVFPLGLARGDVTFTDNSMVDVRNNKNGDIRVLARNINIFNGSLLLAGIYPESGGENSQAGNIVLDASGAIQLSQSSGVRNTIGDNAIGNAGNLLVTARSLSIEGNSQLSISTFGQGSAGDLIINADNIILDGADSGFFARVDDMSNEGAGGRIYIDSQSLSLFNAAQITTSTESNGDADSIVINTQELSLQNGSQIFSSSFGIGNAGDIIVNATDSISIDGSQGDTISGIFSSLEQPENALRNSMRQGGDVQISTRFFSLTNDAELRSAAIDGGIAGTVIINSTDRIQLDRSGIFSSLSGNQVGRGSDILIETQSLSLSNGAQISASTDGVGNSGDIRIWVGSLITLDGRSGNRPTGLFTTVGEPGRGEGGNIHVETRSLSLMDDARLSAITQGQGSAGSIMVNANQSILMDGVGGTGRSAGIFTGTEANATGRANLITLNTPSLSLSNGAVLNASTANARPGGSITLNTNVLEAATGGQILVSTSGSGSAGDITLNIRDRASFSGVDLTFNDRLNRFGREVTANGGIGESGLFANTRPNSTGNGGTITMNGGNLSLRDSAQIAAFTAGTGIPGDVVVSNADSIALDNSIISTTINSGATLSDSAGQGDINLQTRQLNLINGAEITASTVGRGNAGNIGVRDAENVSLTNSLISTEVAASEAVGQGGNINISTDELNLHQGQISSSTAGQGNTGFIAIQANNGIELRNNSRITSEVERGSTGNSQQITLNAPHLLLMDDSVVSAATDGNGSAGNIRIQNADTVSLFNSRISTEIQRNAVVPSNDTTRSQTRSRLNSNQSDIIIETDRLNLDNGSEITASTNGQGRAGNIRVNHANRINLNDNSSISSAVRRYGQGRGGSVTLETDLLHLNDSRITASTNSQSRAGNIRINTNRLEATNGNISANTTRSGQGGTIDLTTQILNLNDGGTISTTSQRQGQAGNIRITAGEQLQLADGSITTSANRSNGGNITIKGGDLNLTTGSNIRTDVNQGQGEGGDININADHVRLQDNSDVQTRVGIDGRGDGGNIDVTADSVIAFDDSDIITEAPQGQGGDITLNTPVFLGTGYQPNSSPGDANGNGRVDLDASGSVSSGTIQTPDTSFIQNSLSDLPATAIDPDILLANSCIARTRAGGRFLITGTGGLPTDRPDTIPASSYPTDTVRTESDDATWQPGDPIVEPQGVYQLPDGSLVMSRECGSH